MHRRRRRPFISGLGGALCAVLALAWLPATPAAASERLTLQECLRTSLERNPELRSAQLEPLLAEADYLAAQGVFDPTVFLTVTFTDRTDPLSTRTILAVQGLLTAVDSTTVIGAFGVGGLTAAGTQYDLTVRRTRLDSTLTHFLGTSGQYDVDVTGRLTQPLARNFGIGVTTTQVRVATLGRAAAMSRLEAALIEQLFVVEQAYWRLVLALEEREVRAHGVTLAQSLLDETRARLEVGVVAPLAVLEARTGLAVRDEGLLLAGQAVGNARDALRRLLVTSAADAAWQTAIVPADAPDIEIIAVDMTRGAEAALRRRPELEQLRIGLAQARLQVAFEKNQRLPEINLLAEGGYRAVELSPHLATDAIFNGSDPHWLLGIEVAVPWGNRSARGAHRRAVAVERRTQTELRRSTQLIVADVRRAARELTTGLQRVEATKVALRLAEQQLTAEETKLEVGVSTPFDVRQKQDDVLEARANALEALIGYRLAVANAARAEGRYLERIGLQVAVGHGTPGPPAGPPAQAADDPAAG